MHGLEMTPDIVQNSKIIFVISAWYIKKVMVW